MEPQHLTQLWFVTSKSLFEINLEIVQGHTLLKSMPNMEEETGPFIPLILMFRMRKVSPLILSWHLFAFILF